MAAETGRKLLVALVIIAFVCCGLTQANKKGFIRKKFNSPNLVGKHEVQAEVQTTAVPSPSVPPPPSCSTDTICAQLNVIANVINILANQTAELHNGTHLPECHVHLEAANQEAGSQAANIVMNNVPVWAAGLGLGNALYLARMNILNCSLMEINVYNNSNDADSAYQLSNYLDNVPYGQIFFGVSVGDISNLWQTAYLGNLGLTFNDMNPFDSLVFIAKLGWPYLAVWDHSTNSSISASLDANLRGGVIWNAFFEKSTAAY